MERPSKGRSAQLVRIIWPFFAVVVLLVALAMASIGIMSSLRAYIGGESTWSRSQKDAVLYLLLYADTGDERAYRRYAEAMAIPSSLERARRSLEPETPDITLAREAFIAGGMNPSDVPGMIWTFRACRHLGYFREALGYWSRSDAELAKLRELAATLHARLGDGARLADMPEAIGALKERIWQIDAAAAPQAAGFAVVLGKAFRSTASLLLAIDLMAAIALLSLCAVHVRRLIGERGRIEAALMQSEARAKATLGSIGEAVIATGPAGNIEFVNPAAERIVGRPALVCLGRPLAETFRLFDETSRMPVDPIAEAHFGQPADLILLNSMGDEVFVQAVISRISDAARGPGAASPGMGFVLILRNMTREREYIESLAWQASHDALTGLVNRAEFERRLSASLDAAPGQAAERASALLVLDLDRFKVVNDTCGHAAGDALLREVAARFARCVRASDTLARLGGDEFAMLLFNYDTADVEALAERVRASLGDFVFNWEAQPLATSVSVGVVDLREASMSVEEALRLADISCYMAKARGRDRVQVADLRDHELARHASEVSWGRRLTAALEHEQFCLYAQPIVEVCASRGTCHDASHDAPRPAREPRRAELLVRMLEPGGAVISPNLFVPAAERYGLMSAIDRWVVKTAFDALCVDGPRRFDEYAINLSGASVGDERFLDFVREQFARTGIAPQLICFEITETAAIANLASAARFMRELNALGCRFALDDFGAGMSSFGYLKHLPVEYLKIDGSFVMDIVHDPVSRDMVAAINEMGHSMKCRTIAEYVENDGILSVLREIGVDYAQGFHIGRPLPWTEEAERQTLLPLALGM
jgi:diguanylate cyclase (GGDEF)-like protein